MRVATLNLLHSLESLEERVAHLVHLLGGEELDFLCLQEVLRPELAGFDIAQRVAEGLGLPYFDYQPAEGRHDGVATLSRFPLERPVVHNPSRLFLVTRSEVNGRDVYVMNIHAAWGRNNATRMEQTVDADSLARQFFGAPTGREDRPVVILAGDMNATPEAENIRYLLGHDAHAFAATLWVDVWDAAVENEPASGWTTGYPTYLAKATANRDGSFSYLPEAMPKRRIDYIFVHEWAWGQAGSPLSARRFAMETFVDSRGVELTVSDHYGVMADLFMPDEA